MHGKNAHGQKHSKIPDIQIPLQIFDLQPFTYDRNKSLKKDAQKLPR